MTRRILRLIAFAYQFTCTPARRHPDDCNILTSFTADQAYALDLGQVSGAIAFYTQWQDRPAVAPGNLPRRSTAACSPEPPVCLMQMHEEQPDESNGTL
jgi:hypothetical protein